MSAFYVGQRVKLARPVYPENAGATGTILALGYWQFMDELPNGRFFGGGDDADCYVTWDRAMSTAYGPSRETPNRTSQLEPILPPGLESLEEINALYEPSPVEVRA